ncbi:pyruvate carboxylase, partial [Streptomyces azureus]
PAHPPADHPAGRARRHGSVPRGRRPHEGGWQLPLRVRGRTDRRPRRRRTGEDRPFHRDRRPATHRLHPGRRHRDHRPFGRHAPAREQQQRGEADVHEAV